MEKSHHEATKAVFEAQKTNFELQKAHYEEEKLRSESEKTLIVGQLEKLREDNRDLQTLNELREREIESLERNLLEERESSSKIQSQLEDTETLALNLYKELEESRKSVFQLQNEVEAFREADEKKKEKLAQRKTEQERLIKLQRERNGKGPNVRPLSTMTVSESIALLKAGRPESAQNKRITSRLPPPEKARLQMRNTYF